MFKISIKFHRSFFNLIIFFQLFLQILNKRGFSFLEETNEESKSNVCTLTGKASMDPFPSLSKCYKYNNEACCLSVHDEIIKDYINSILSTSCIRKYPQFENLMCLGCHPSESKYIDKTNKIIRVCKDFAKSFWNTTSDEGLNTKTEIFDNCGFKATNITKLVEKAKTLNRNKYIIPSEAFANFSDFFSTIQIPFYEEYKIVIQNNTNNSCYNQFNYINVNYALLFILIFFNFYF